MSWVLAIDFGTAVTAAATMQLGGSALSRPMPVEVGGSWRVPSGVLRLDTGELVIGMSAERQAALRIEAYEATPKRRMGEGVMNLGGPVPVVEAIAAVLRVMAAEAIRSRGGTRPSSVCLTHPASWAAPRLQALRKAAELAGLTYVLLLPEPVAAASWYAATSGRVPAGGRVAVYDLGGGTFDAAVVESNGDGTFSTVGRPGGVDPLGGVDFDFALLDLVGATIRQRDSALWDTLDQPTDSSARRRRRALLGQVRALKEDLSTVTQSTLLVPETSMEVTITRAEFDAVIGPHIQRSAAVLEETIAAAGTTAAALTAVYLVGGSSRIPLVEEVIAQRLHVTPATLDEPKQVVAYGAVTHLAALANQAAAAAPRQRQMPGPQPAPAHPAWSAQTAPAVKSKTGLIVAALLALVLVLGGVILTVVLLNRDSPSTARADSGGSGESGGTDPGSGDGGGGTGDGPSAGVLPPGALPGDLSGYAYLDQLAQSCHAAVMTDCDVLYQQSPEGSAYRDYGYNCGGRITTANYPAGGAPSCPQYVQDLAAGGFSLPPGTDSAALASSVPADITLYDQEAQDCYGGDMAACNALYLGSPAGSAYETYGGTCGGRVADDQYQGQCTDYENDVTGG